MKYKGDTNHAEIIDYNIVIMIQQYDKSAMLQQRI